MSNVNKIENRNLRKRRIRSIVIGSKERPRLSVFISNKNVTAQIIDDANHLTIAYASTIDSKEAKGSLTEKAQWVGEQIAKKAKASKVKNVVFDRNGRLYHGRIKALADKARETGLEF